jgi:hypothetical protein
MRTRFFSLGRITNNRDSDAAGERLGRLKARVSPAEPSQFKFPRSIPVQGLPAPECLFFDSFFNVWECCILVG